MQSLELRVNVVRQLLYFLIPSTEKFNSLELVAMHLLGSGASDLVSRQVIFGHVVVGLSF